MEGVTGRALFLSEKEDILSGEPWTLGFVGGWAVGAGGRIHLERWVRASLALDARMMCTSIIHVEQGCTKGFRALRM